MTKKELYEEYADINTQIDIIVQNIQSEINDLQYDARQLRKIAKRSQDRLEELENADLDELTSKEVYKLDGIYSALKMFLHSMNDFADDLDATSDDYSDDIENAFTQIDSFNNLIEEEIDDEQE